MSSQFSLERYQHIKAKYGKMSSWAIWKVWDPSEKPKAGMGDTSFFESPTPEFLQLLKPNIIFVALNISKEIDRPFGNFHPNYARAHDYKLRYALQDTPLWGGYITDIIKDFEEKASENLMQYLRRNPHFLRENIKSFKQELQDIGAISPTLIALGRDTDKILRKHLGERWLLFRVSHYSASISKETLRAEIQEVLFELSKAKSGVKSLNG